MADHANNLAIKIRNNLTNSIKALGVDILTGFGSVLVSLDAFLLYLAKVVRILTHFEVFVFLQGPQKVKYGKDNIITAKNIIIATGSVPFVPKGIEVDGTCLVLLLVEKLGNSLQSWLKIFLCFYNWCCRKNGNHQ